MEMQSSFKHFILTRYALRMPDGALPNAEWLTHRRELFERYTLPSVAAQTVSNYVWLLFYDWSLDEQMDECLRAWQMKCPWIMGVGTEQPWEEFNLDMRRAMNRHLEGATHVISTRLDNDDAIAPDFLALVQAEFRAQIEPTFVNFTVGQNLTVATNQLEEHPHPHNMFISCIEPVKDFQAVLTWAHNHCPAVGPVIQLAEPARWTHIVHDRNVWPPGRRHTP